MGEAFITRRGGIGSEQALAPTITEVSTTETSITFTITNNDASTAVILYEVDDATPDANSIELAAAATSSNIVVTGLAEGTAFDVYATANVTGKVKSNVTELEISTDPADVYTAATGGTTQEYDLDSKRYKSHTFTSNGTFEVTTVGDAINDRNKVDYLIIAGGGGGGTNGANGTGAGGGGTGGYRTTVGTSGQNSAARSKVTVTATTFAVTIGSGGTGSSDRTGHGVNGGTSSVAFSSTVSTTGGGGGASNLATANISAGAGGHGSEGLNNKFGGAALADEFFAGGNGGGAGTSNVGSGGGGAGAASAGTNGVQGSTQTGGAGGNGLANLLRTGSNETRGVGGKGGDIGLGNSSGANGTANTGNGGGGANMLGSGGNGGAGIVVIRYEIAPSV